MEFCIFCIFRYISQAPSLTHLPEDVFAGMPDTFRSLYVGLNLISPFCTGFYNVNIANYIRIYRRIINSGLQHIPDMSPLSKHEILQMVYVCVA